MTLNVDLDFNRDYSLTYIEYIICDTPSLDVVYLRATILLMVSQVSPVLLFACASKSIPVCQCSSLHLART